MFARHLTPYEAEQAEREKVKAKAPHLALVEFTPPSPKPAEPDHFVWHSVGDLLERRS